MLVYRTRLYLKRCRKIFIEADQRKAEEDIAANPSVWPVISGGGGVRKARVTRGDLGKRGGARVIYFWLDRHREIYFLTVYAKNEKDDLSSAELKEWKMFVSEIRKEKDNVKT